MEISLHYLFPQSTSLFEATKLSLSYSHCIILPSIKFIPSHLTSLPFLFHNSSYKTHTNSIPRTPPPKPKMALETMSSTDLLNLLIYESICGNPNPFSLKQDSTFDHFPPPLPPSQPITNLPILLPSPPPFPLDTREPVPRNPTPALAVQPRKKRRRRPKVCKNKEEAETQRMTHIVVERNRRKQMNHHLAVLRSLMPESYAQRGDQASIVGGAIDYVKELEHLLQSQEAQRLTLHQPNEGEISAPPFAEFFAFPQYTWSQPPAVYNSKADAIPVADIEVSFIESHANIRILSKKRPRQLSKLVAGFQVLRLSVLHLNVTSFDTLVLYSLSAKVEEGCQLTSVDEIAEATHHMVRIIEEEAALC